MIDFFNVNHPNFTFEELHRLSVTSHEILLWSSSIDLAERYQYYIDQPTKSNRLNKQFFNCTSPWFGSYCQYSLELVSNFSEATLNVQRKSHMTDAITHQTCYNLLECDRGAPSMCLDWREICDGRIDCFNDGVDESQCFELEINECNENEYRCHNGLCIPKRFWDDEYFEAECLDKSDLLETPECPDTYLQVNMFACAENACRPDEGRFPCGDGQCVEDFGKCRNGRHLLLAQSLSVQGNLSYDCWIAMICLSKIIDHVNEVSCDQFVNLSQILPRLETCEYLIQFPTVPVLLGHVRFLYHPKQDCNTSIELALLPDYVCYDEQLCDYLTPTFHHGNLTCRYGDEIGLGPDIKVSDWKSIIDLVKPHFHGCITRHYHDVAIQVGDGIVDCLGAADELEYCRQKYSYEHTYGFYCRNDTRCIEHDKLCDGVEDCLLGDDEQICENRSRLCEQSNFDNVTYVEYVLCRIGFIHRPTFSLKTVSIYPPSSTIRIGTVNNQWNERYINSSFDDFVKPVICNYGLHVYHWLGPENTSDICFCPPNYYGDRCQYQNQRVSLTITMGLVQQQRIYAIVVTLIEDDDNRQEIHSYHQLTQESISRCGRPFNIYLLYSVRPKNNSKKYNIRIDAFDKSSLIYLASWRLKIPFAFLPVNRLAIFLTLPAHRTLRSGHCPLPCYKGTCMKYLNEERYFCRCYSGWSGAQCHIQIDCSSCSSHSICVGPIQNRPICVCPVGKFGSRCLLKQLCPINFCQNNGQCVVIDDRMLEDSFVCICPEAFTGIRCEEITPKIVVFFQNIDVPSYLVAYIYSGINYGQPVPAFVILQKVKMFQYIVTFYPFYSFYMVVLKIDVSYYLAVLQQIASENISTSVGATQRCVPFQELFSSELLALPRIHRLKSYHVPCQNNVDLQCFIDESYMCLCTVERHSNCFLFDFNMTMVCPDDVYCENGGICLQDRPPCPRSILCVCTDCFFGDRCQFYAKGIGLTLDDMLRYVIRPNLALNEQSIVIKLSAAFTMIILVAGLLNSLLSYLVFHHKNSRQVGSGMYLHLSAVVSGLVASLLTMKFWFVVFTHIDQSTNRGILHGGCVFLEIVLKFFLHMSNWLNACVAIERVIAVFKGIHFNKKQSKCIARWTLRVLPFFILGTLSHEFVYRGLFDDYEEQRVWCVFRYSQSIEKYSTAIQLSHFIAPFLINLFSALFIIFNMTRQQAIIQTCHSYEQHLLAQFNEHKQLIVSSIVLVILSLPRLIISLFSGCVKVSRNPWLYLSGYFISFIPSAFLFVIFVLPSTLYKKQFRESINSWKRLFFR
ncbi:unnamed protein product [Rotaria sp. Silwood2]|nr:unnamed protein product [Rotaria sp. Silwood2]CAF2926969.1 unnamed protein product [Rotaria sp. Silwood2]CAF4208795.1 unnamed protein product [Rotaria sp. Silwood2]